MRFVLLLFFSWNVFAAAKTDMICVKDGRPVGGEYQSFSVEKNQSGKFDVRYTFIPSEKALKAFTVGFNLPVNNERVAVNLDCVASQLDERIRLCYSAGTYDSRLETTFVSRSDLREAFGATTHVMVSTIELSFFSSTFTQKTVAFDPGTCTLK